MAINKVFAACQEAVADIPEGATIMFGGFGAAGVPMNLIQALKEQGAKNLTTIGNYCPAPLVENHQVKKAIAAFPVPASLSRRGMTALERQVNEGEIELEITPQGTLAERIRAGGAGIGGFYTPTGVGTIVEKGKEKKVIDGREYILELALKADFAFIKAYKADRLGNLVYRMASRNFNPPMATASRVTIVEVDELVEIGELDPEVIVTAGIYVHRMVKVPRVPVQWRS
jgi:3-oxoacid CoA-transferase subunit A